MTDWTDHDALAEALIDEIEATFPQPMRPGDITIAMYAEQRHMARSTAASHLQAAERAGKLVSVRAVVPGARVPMRVWRKPS